MMSLHFIRPYWFLVLIPLIFLFVILVKKHHKKSAWESLCDPHLFTYLWEGQSQKISRWPLLVFALAYISLVLALTGPTWEKLSRPVYRNEDARVIVVDMSLAQWSQDITPSRLERTRYKLLDILQNTKDGQTGLIAFAGEPYIVSPLTQDTNTLSDFIPELTPAIMPMQGHNIARALQQAEKLLQQAGVQKGNILLISANSATLQDNQKAEELRKQGYSVSVLGMGTSKGTPITLSNGQLLKDSDGNIIIPTLDKDSLKSLASAGGGKYHGFTADNQDLNALLTTSQNLNISAQSQDSMMLERWRDTGRWFILPLIPLLLLGFRRGWLRELLS